MEVESLVDVFQEQLKLGVQCLQRCPSILAKILDSEAHHVTQQSHCTRISQFQEFTPKTPAHDHHYIRKTSSSITYTPQKKPHNTDRIPTTEPAQHSTEPHGITILPRNPKTFTSRKTPENSLGHPKTLDADDHAGGEGNTHFCHAAKMKMAEKLTRPMNDMNPMLQVLPLSPHLTLPKSGTQTHM